MTCTRKAAWILLMALVAGLSAGALEAAGGSTGKGLMSIVAIALCQLVGVMAYMLGKGDI